MRLIVLTKIIMVLGVLGYMWMGTAQHSIAQDLIVRQGIATVPIKNENLAQAEDQAIILAKRYIIEELLAQYIAPQILSQAPKLINARILNNPDRFIESIRVIESKESQDLSEFSITLEARVFQSKLISSLKQLNLALTNDPIRRVVLIYDPRDPFWGNVQKKNSLHILNRFLDPYKIHLQQTTPLTSEWWETLPSNPQQPLPQSLVEKSKFPAFLLIDFNQKSSPSNKEISITLTLKLYDAAKGNFLQEVQTSKVFKNWQPKQGITMLLEQITLQWHPLISALISVEQKKGEILQIKLLGLTSPQQESVLVRDVFMSQSLWRQFHLITLARDYVIYQGYYSGNRQELIKQLKAVQHPLYHISQVGWQDNQLEIQVQWTEKPTSLEEYQPSDVVEQWLDNHNIPHPQKKVPSERIKTTYELPLSTAVYDYLRSRGDSTFYRVDSQAGKTMEGTWYQIDKTNLTPVLSIYDEQRNLVERYTSNQDGKIHFRYRLPNDQSHFYIRINDQIGYVEGEAGSFLSLHYVLEIFFQKQAS